MVIAELFAKDFAKKPLIENRPHLGLSGPAGRQSGQGMGRVILWAKYSTGCLSGGIS
jgi:hypothetical protein